MRQFSLLKSIPFAFFSKTLYQDVKENWQGHGFAYLLLVVFLCALPAMYKTHIGINQIINSLEPLTEQIPTITITEGKVSIDKPMPYIIKEPTSQKTFVIIDTTQDAATLEKANSLIVITQNQLVLQNNTVGTKVYDLSEIKNEVISQSEINTWVKRLKYSAFLFFYSLVFLFYFITSLLLVLFYAGLAKLVVHNKLAYRSTCRLAAVALTPTLVLIALLSIFNVILPYKAIVYLVLSLGYLFFAIEANKHSR